MQRYFVQSTQMNGNTITMTGDDAHHIIRVMRAAEGDQFIVSDGERREVLAEVSRIDKQEVTAMVIEERPMTNEPRVDVWIAQSLPKGDKMETVIQKCTELGAVRFVPFISERTVVQYDAKKEAKLAERWSRIAKEAAEQAHRNIVPGIQQPISWKQLLAAVREESFDAALLCYEKHAEAGFRELLRKLAARGDEAGKQRPTVLVVVGPEGGFTPQEAQDAEAAGLLPVTLGRRILRTETAAMTALACVLYEYGEIGG